MRIYVFGAGTKTGGWLKLLLLWVFVVLLSSVASAQNTKGDKPVQNRESRESRFKVRKKQGDKARPRDVAGRRLRTKNFSTAKRARAPGESPRFRRKNPDRGADQPSRIGANRRVGSTRAARARNIYPSRGFYVNNPARKPGSDKPNALSGRYRVTSRGPSSEARRTYKPGSFPTARKSPAGRRQNVYPSRGNTYGRNPSHRPGNDRPKWSAGNMRVTSRNPSANDRRNYDPRKYPKARRSVTARRRNVYPARGTYVNNPARAPRSRVKPVSNQAQLSRARRYGTQREPVTRKTRVSPRSESRSFISSQPVNFLARYPKPRQRKRDFVGKDLTGYPLRRRNYHSTPQVFEEAMSPYKKKGVPGDHAYAGKAGGYKSATRRTPEPWSGDIAGRRLRGRKELTKLPYAGRAAAGNPGKDRALSKFRGNAIPARGFGLQGAGYRGSIKARRPLRGGGSATAFWNNKGQAVVGRTPSGADERMAAYQGNIRRYGNRPTFGSQGADFRGNVKANKPLRGGGGTATAFWNNKGDAVVGRAPSRTDERMAAYQGNIRRYGNRPTFGSQGALYRGDVRASKPLKGAGGSMSGEMWNNDQRAVQVRLPADPEAWRTRKFEGLVQVKRAKPKGNITEGLHVRVKDEDRRRNSSAASGALKGVPPSRSAIAAGAYAKGTRRDWRYVRNPNSDDESLKAREPGKATARSASFHGSVKVRTFNLFGKNESYPDARFEKSNRNNVEGERGLINNFLLIWSKWFKKNETVPSRAKEKSHRPRFDKDEKGLWYD